MKRLAAFVAAVFVLTAGAHTSPYPWLEGPHRADTLVDRFTPRDGFERVPVTPDSFAAFLRHLPLRQKGTPLRTYDGKRILLAAHAAAIIELDVGQRDLQQCADTLIRLYAEYRFAAGQAEALSFNFTSGHAYPYRAFLLGRRPIPSGSNVTWRTEAASAPSRAAFRDWLDIIFTYAGTASLARDLNSVRPSDAGIGDIFITPGFPGHTVMIADMAVNPKTRERDILLIEGFTPAQDAHVLRNLFVPWRGSWFSLENDQELATPVWTFSKNSLYRFADQD